jgi:hypothetical protein
LARNSKLSSRAVGIYFSLSHAAESGAPLGVLENRFAALFEVRRLLWPRYENFADPVMFDQGIAGFLDHILFENFNLFAQLAQGWTQRPVQVAQRRSASAQILLDEEFLAQLDTLIIISFDSVRTAQVPGVGEIAAVASFLEDPQRIVFVCPHHNIGSLDGLAPEQFRVRQEAEFHHHGDRVIPPQQQFGGFGIALLQGLGLQVQNRFGLHPAKTADGSPADLEIFKDLDRFGFLEGVKTFNLHPHLPHFEVHRESAGKLDVLARQEIDLDAPMHPFVQAGNRSFNALLQSTKNLFAGSLLICDATTWSSTAGGLEGLRRFWQNVVQR